MAILEVILADFRVFQVGRTRGGGSPPGTFFFSLKNGRFFFNPPMGGPSAGRCPRREIMVTMSCNMSTKQPWVRESSFTRWSSISRVNSAPVLQTMLQNMGGMIQTLLQTIDATWGDDPNHAPDHVWMIPTMLQYMGWGEI